MRLYQLSRELRMPPFPGAIMEQPDGIIKRLEVIMRIRSEDDARSMNNDGPPPKE